MNPMEALLGALLADDVDAQLAGPTELHCLGGFVLAECCGLA